MIGLDLKGLFHKYLLTTSYRMLLVPMGLEQEVYREILNRSILVYYVNTRKEH